jgi:hypothetical protein
MQAQKGRAVRTLVLTLKEIFHNTTRVITSNEAKASNSRTLITFITHLKNEILFEDCAKQ